jgi:solute carrier family 12 sodium/potassium/chloride transporter 2
MVNTKKFGTFEGVFTPTVLSIVGVVMYLRLGWVVGQVGLGEALLIITISNLITLCTGLSIASITTNLRVGAGGAYSIISKSFGLEAGGAVGIPLYISQAISVGFYITGFTECWVHLFPQHNFTLVAIITWLILLIISYTSARLAFRIQYFIMAVIALSLLSAFLGKNSFGHPVSLIHGVREFSFWYVFAIFFPAVTGILAGVSMSGELKEPGRNIPIGVLSAITITFCLYIAVAIWFASVASPEDLVKNTSIIIEAGRWHFLVIGGIMGATLSSALSMFVASPRTLFALAKHRVIPLSSPFSYISTKGEPTTAVLLTALIALIVLVLGTLDTIAGILTMFFLITYGMLNSVVFFEKVTGIVSFRPAFKIPLIVSLVGAIGCFYAMFLINQLFSIIAIVVTLTIYIILVRREFGRSWPDVRKGVFVFIAEEAVKIASRLPYHPKIWKPNLLVPVEDPRSWIGMVDFLKAITCPKGRIDFFTVMNIANPEHTERTKEMLTEDFPNLTEPLREEGLLVNSFIIESDDIVKTGDIISQTLSGTVLSPNVLFVKLGLEPQNDGMLEALIERAQSLDYGIIAFRYHPKSTFGQKQKVNLWIKQGSPNIHLATLIALQLQKN